MWIRHLLLASNLALGLPAWSQTVTAPVGAVTLPQVLQAARDNIDVSLSRRALAAARADVLAADHSPVPVLSAKAGSIDLQNGIGAGSLLREKRVDKSVGLDWTLERGNKRELRTRSAQRNVLAAQADLEESQVLQQLAAAAAFYDLLAAQDKVVQLEGIGQGAAELAVTAERRVRAGDLSRQEEMRTRIEAERVQADWRSAQAERLRAALALRQLTGLNGDLVAAGGWPVVVPQAPAPAPPVESRADVRAAEQRVEASQAAIGAAVALRRNDMTVGASIDHFPGTSTRQLELRLQMPLGGVLGGYGFEGEIARAQALLAQAQDQLEKTRRAGAAEAQRLQADLQSSAARALGYHADIVPRARQVADMAELAYRKGALSLADLIDARRTLRSVLLDDITARADYARVLAAWQLRNQPAPSP